MLLPAVVLFLLFLTILSDNIKAQIVGIISEDGDGITGITSLMNAVINNDVQTVKFFAKSRLGVVNQKNIGGATALHIATRSGNAEIVQALIESGADVNAADNESWTPLMRASVARNPEIIKILLNSKANVQNVNSLGETAIINSTSSECLECLKQLFLNYDLEQNINFDNIKNQLESAIMIANNKNNQELQTFLKEYAAKFYAKVSNSTKNKVVTTPTYSFENNNSEEKIMLPMKKDNNNFIKTGSLDDDQSKSSSISYKFTKGDITSNNQIIINLNKKPIYKFLVQKDQSQQIKLKQILQQNNNTLQITSNKLNKEEAYKIIASKSPNSYPNVKFVFKGSKKSYSPTSTIPLISK